MRWFDRLMRRDCEPIVNDVLFELVDLRKRYAEVEAALVVARRASDALSAVVRAEAEAHADAESARHRCKIMEAKIQQLESDLCAQVRANDAMAAVVRQIAYLRKPGQKEMHMWTPELAKRGDMDPVPLIEAMTNVIENRLGLFRKTVDQLDAERREQLSTGVTIQRLLGQVEQRVEQVIAEKSVGHLDPNATEEVCDGAVR